MLGTRAQLRAVFGPGVERVKLEHRTFKTPTGRAVEMTTVVIITEAVFEEKMRKADPFIRGLLNLFVRTIRDVTDKMVGTES